MGSRFSSAFVRGSNWDRVSSQVKLISQLRGIWILPRCAYGEVFALPRVEQSRMAEVRVRAAILKGPSTPSLGRGVWPLCADLGRGPLWGSDSSGAGEGAPAVTGVRVNTSKLLPGTEVWGEGSGVRREPFQMRFPNENIPFNDLGLISILSLGSLPRLDGETRDLERSKETWGERTGRSQSIVKEMKIAWWH